MKLRKYEIAVIAVALIFISFASGFFTGKRQTHGPVTIETEYTTAAPSVAPSPSPSAIALPTSSDSSAQNDTLISINTAASHELVTLPHIGEVLAERIITYRNENGGFDSIEEILNVTGIGDVIFNDIRELITVE